MKNIGKIFLRFFGKRTITRDLTLGLNITVSIVLILLGFVNYFYSVQRLESDLNRQAKDTTQKMVDILSVPLWTLDQKSIEGIGDSFGQSENVADIKIIDENGKTLYASTTGEMVVLTTQGKIDYQGRTIGLVEIAFSSQQIQDARLNTFLNTLLIIILVGLTIQFVTWRLLQRYLTQPLEVLTEGIENIANGSDYHGLPAVSQADINEIVQAVNQMAHQIEERVEALRQSEDRLRQVVNSISDMIYMTEITPSGEVINHLISPHTPAMTGYPANAFIEDWNFYNHTVIYPEDRGLADQQWQNLQNGISSETEYRLQHANGSLIWVRDSARVETVNGSRMIFGVLSNITSRKKVEEDLRQETLERKMAEEELKKYQTRLEDLVFARTSDLEEANKELESFAYSISHDLRAPLRHIDGYAHIILEDYNPQLPQEVKSYLVRICNGSQTMSNLIDGLLNFSHLGRQPLTIQPVNTAWQITQVLEDLSLETAGRNIDFQIGNLPDCQADPLLLRQVFVNLLSNAIKYTREREQAVIKIGAECLNGECVFYIKDNGIGFDMAYAHKLFGVFQRLHAPNQFEGTGVGLAIVHRIILRHGGKIWAESAPDQGATFYFSLPSPNGKV
jgi:PAS domain S-box-containing protein